MLRGNNSNLPSQLLLAAVLLLLAFMPTAAQTTSFTYQGRLNDGGTPANGTYGKQFELYSEYYFATGQQQFQYLGQRHRGRDLVGQRNQRHDAVQHRRESSAKQRGRVQLVCGYQCG